MTATLTRNDIVNEAIRWFGTPYHHQASLKGVGCDCLGLIRGVWRELIGEEPEEAPNYSPDWSLGGETMLDAARRHLVEIAPADSRPGDVLLFRFRRHWPAKHAGILIDGDKVIHAMSGAGVVAFSLDDWWTLRVATAFMFPGAVR